MKKEDALSVKLSEIIYTLNKCVEDYQTAYAEVSKCDKATQDILHAIELGGYKERDKLATRLAHVRRERRVWKDVVDNTEPLYSFVISSDKMDTKCFLKKLEGILGEVRKRERSKNNRIYLPKVLTDMKVVYSTKEVKK